MAKKKKEGMTPTMIIQIAVGQKGEVQISGFPAHFFVALDVMAKAFIQVAWWFVCKAREGKVLANGEIEQSKIITPDKHIILPPGNA